MKKIYLAIPYSGMMESSFTQANEFAACILNLGRYNVFSPISHCHSISMEHNLPTTWEFWSEIDYQFLDWSDEIWVLIPEEGALSVGLSIGVQAELKYMKEQRKPIKFYRKIGDTYQETTTLKNI